jgi:hypothetical protein
MKKAFSSSVWYEELGKNYVAVLADGEAYDKISDLTLRANKKHFKSINRDK